LPHSSAGHKHVPRKKQHKRSWDVHEEMGKGIIHDAEIELETGRVTKCPAFSMNPKTPYDGISPEVPERKEATKPKLCITTRRCREAAMDQNSTGHRAIPIGHSGFCLLTPVSRISKNEGASGDVHENKGR
jgi:hypothetical protein